MKKLLIVLLFLSITINASYAYAIKVYDNYGNRVGTYRKEGDNFVLYDFNDNKIENPEEYIKNAPTQKTLTEYTRYFYDENMNPIGSYSTGFFGNNGRYYPRGHIQPRCFYPTTRSNYIVRPRANTSFYNLSF